MRALAYEPDLPRATYADLEDLPAGVTGEILFGELCMTPRPSFRHGRAASKLSMMLGAADRPLLNEEGRGGSGWLLVVEPELRMRGDAVVPDIAGWHRDRMTAFTGRYVDIAPDWVCEVLSPSTARRDWRQKSAWYLEVGVGWYWIVDADARTVQCLQATPTGWDRVAVAEAAAHVALPPFTGVGLAVGSLWTPESP